MNEIIPLGPETGTDLVGDIEPPSVHTIGGISVSIGIHPAAGDGEEVGFDLGMQIFFALLVGDLDEFGHTFQAPPPCVVKLVLVLGRGVVELVDIEPGGVGRVLLFFTEIGKGKKFSRAVVKDSVENEMETTEMGLADEFEE